MQIFYDSAYSEKLTAMIYEKFMEDAQNRTQVHLSDLTRCHIKCWNRLVGIKRLPFTARSVGIMMIGVVGQEIIQNVYPEDWAEFEPSPDIPSHIDVYVQEEGRPNFPLEVKWSRKGIYRGGDMPKYWLDQGTGYMALVNECLGRFAIMNMISGQLNCFKVMMTQEEIDARRQELDDQKALIWKAVEEKNPFLLPITIDDCKYCDWRDTRSRKNQRLGRGCPRYKDRKTANLDMFLSSAPEQPEPLVDS